MLEIVAVPQCAHTDVRDCPLYHASHAPGLSGCCTGDWALGCSVARGEVVYAETVAALRWKHREWWQAFTAHVVARQAQEQRERNILQKP